MAVGGKDDLSSGQPRSPPRSGLCQVVYRIVFEFLKDVPKRSVGPTGGHYGSCRALSPEAQA